MKKILFSAYSLDIGGIEKALITLANYLQEKGYDITIVLEKKQGVFLQELNSKIRLVEYTPDDSQNILKRKLNNLAKRVKFYLRYKNKFDFSASFATYSMMGSVVSRIASKNNCLWCHADYLTLFNDNKAEVIKFFKDRKYNKFKNIVFVSEEGKNSFLKIFPQMAKRTVVCNNLIDYKQIEKLATEKIEISKQENVVTFLNVGRHDERQKRLTRIIESAKKLKDQNYKFRILLVGDGPDRELYERLVKENHLEKQIIFMGKQQNPYPYFKIADCVLLTSDYEGYPVTFLESFVLNVPIITTKVSDYQQVEGKYGYVAEKSTEDVYNKMKLFIEKGFEIKEKFEPEKYNSQIVNKLEKIIEGKNVNA